MAKKSLTKAELIAAHDEINKEIGFDPEVNADLALDEYEKELARSIYDIEMEDDEVEDLSENTQKVVAELAKKYPRSFFEEDDSDDDDDDDDEEEEEVPAPPPSKKGKKVVEPEPDEEDDDDEEEPEEEEEKSVTKGKKAKKPIPEPEDDDDEEDDEQVVKKGKADKKPNEKPDKKVKKVKVPKIEEEDDDDEDEKQVVAKKVKKDKPAEKKAKSEKAPAVEWPKGMAYGDVVNFEDRSKTKQTGTLKKYFWHKQSQKFWFIIDVKGKDFYKHADDVSKAKKAK